MQKPRSDVGLPSDQPEPEVIAGRYEVQAVVGRGGMGAVYRVLDRHSSEVIALKRLRVRVRRKNDSLALFEREFHTLSELRHPGIIGVRDYGIDAHGVFYTMELLSGADMREVAPVPFMLCCKYLRAIATSLALLHARKLVHRDVTPQNVRVSEDGHCKLIDFGALADFGSRGEVIGTPPCVPPEAIEGKPIDQRLDLYGLGCLGYWMLTGQHAYPATDSRQLRTFWARPPTPPSQLPNKAGDKPEVPAALDALIMSLLSLDPMARPSSAGAVIDRLDVVLGNTPVEDRTLADSYLASAPLCGRKVERLKVKLALERAVRGRGTALLVAGLSGAGRTRFLSEIELRAKLAGATTLYVDASQHEGPYATMQALVAQLPRRRSKDSTHAEPPGVAALHGLVVEASRQHPIAVLVDDVHRADEASLRALSALGHEATHLKLLVATTVRTGDETLCETGLHALIQSSTRIELGELGEQALQEWLSAVFGDAPNLGRLCSFLHERTRGRASSVAGLLRFLVARGEVRHRDGSWQLPNEPSQMALPEDAEDTALEALHALDPADRALAEALSMHRGVLSLELCDTMNQQLGEPQGQAAATTALRTRLEALVRCEVLVFGREGYRFASERLRDKLASRIDAPRRNALHLRMGEALLARDPHTALQQLAAGVHFLEARDPRGLQLCTEAASVFSDHIEGIASAMRLLERAVVLAREQGAPPAFMLALLAPLGLGAYSVDHRLVRYTEQIADTLDVVLRLPLARKLQELGRRFGRHASNLLALLGLALGVLRFYLAPKAERPAGYRRVARFGVSAMVALAGRSAICLDKPAIDRIVTRLRPLRALGVRDPGGFAVEYCDALGVATEDRYTQTRERWLWLDSILKAKGAMAELSEDQRKLWSGGVSYALGLFESFRGDPYVLERARELEQSGSDMHAMIAAQLRLQYFGFRGDAEQVRREYERMEICAIQTGSSWQVETWSAISINLFAALWQDVMLAKRAMRETQRMKDEIASLSRYAITSEATYLLSRGQPRDCADLYERLLPNEVPMSRVGWATSLGLLAEAYNQLGLHAEAKATCERVFATALPEDRVYFAMRIESEIPYAVALSHLGEHERARLHLHELLELYADSKSPVALGSVHEALARIAHARGDTKVFTEHLKQVEAHFTKLGNPALIARFQALSDVAGAEGGMLRKVAALREARAFEAAIEPIEAREEGTRAMLAWLMRSCEGYDGYLFAPAEQVGDEPLLLAATSDKEPGSDVFDAVAESLRALGGSADTTNCGTGASTQTRRDGGAVHIFLLSHLEADRFAAEGALVLLGRAPYTPPVRYELLQSAAQQLRRLLGAARDS